MKAQAPLLSIGSSGSFAGIITASSWKGRPYIRQLVTPSNPKSAMQTATRAMFRFLSQAWANLSDGDKASWETKAQQGNYSTFNAYQSYNMNLWGRALAPFKDPTAAAGAVATQDSWSADPGVRSVTLTLGIDTANENWGAVIYMEAASAPEGTQDEVVQVIEATDPTSYVVLITNLTPGTVYHFKYRFFTEGGLYSALSADVNATPTS